MPEGQSVGGLPLGAIFEKGQKPWPGIEVSRERFAAYLERMGISAANADEMAGDLFLAFACLEGNSRAIAAFERHILGLARPVVARLRQNDDFIDEVLQDLRTKFLVGEPKALAGYAGPGPLAAWVRVAATRAAIDALRAQGASPVGTDVTQAVVEEQFDPEVRLLLGAQREAFQQALQESFAALPAQSRNLLRRHLVDGMTLEEIAVPYGVHPATIARRLASLREEIATSVRERLLGQADRLNPQQLDSVFRAIRSQVYVSLSPLISSNRAAPSSRPTVTDGLSSEKR